MDHGRKVGVRWPAIRAAAVLTEADGQVRRYAARFGLTPSDRAQLNTEPIGRDPNWELLSSSDERSRFLT
jgi:Phage terminase, small subunit